MQPASISIAVAALLVSCGPTVVAPVAPQARVASSCPTQRYAVGVKLNVTANWAATCETHGGIDSHDTHDCKAIEHERTLHCGPAGCESVKTPVGFDVTLTQPGQVAMSIDFKSARGEQHTVQAGEVTVAAPTVLEAKCSMSPTSPDRKATVTVSLRAGEAELCGPVALTANGVACTPEHDEGRTYACPYTDPKLDLALGIAGSPLTTTVACQPAT